jgi:ferric-chelate reductase (NADPH)
VVTVGDESYKDYLAHLSAFNITWVVGHSEQAVADHLAALTVPGRLLYLADRGREGGENLSRQFETDAIDQQLVRASAYWHAK